MRILNIELELLDDVIQSARAASAGHHESLDYIQGASLLGAVAGRIYADLGDEAFDAFHSGRVRFCDARPHSCSGIASLPLPLAWMHRKGEQAADEGRLLADKIFMSVAFDSMEKAEGLVQMREGFFSRAGEWVRPGKSYRLRTAIDSAELGRPKEAALFGFEALNEGSRWSAQVVFDAEVAVELEASIAKTLDGSVLRLGASRGVEYGRARVVSVKSQDAGKPILPSSDAREVIVYLESDTALLDSDTGCPCLSPRAELFGLPSTWKVVPHKSALMTRRYSPFNNHRRRRDLERQVLRQGSVLFFEGRDALDLESLTMIASGGVGAYRQDGLGKVIFNPDFLRGEHPEFAKLKKEAGLPNAGDVQPSKLGSWMQKEAEEQKQLAAVWKQARLTADKVKRCLDKAKKNKDIYPGRSQWQHVAALASQELAQSKGNVDNLKKELDKDIFGRGAASHSWIKAEKAKNEFLECGKELDGKVRLRAMALAARLVAHKVAAGRNES